MNLIGVKIWCTFPPRVSEIIWSTPQKSKLEGSISPQMILHDALLIFKHSCQPFFFFYICGICAGCVFVCDINIQRKSKCVIIRNVPTGEKQTALRASRSGCRWNRAKQDIWYPSLCRRLLDLSSDVTGWLWAQKQTQNRAGVFKQRKDDSKSALSITITNQERQPDRQTCDQPINQSIINGKEI